MAPLEAMGEAAVEAGIDTIAVTDHLDFLPGYTFDWQTDFDAAYAALEAARATFAGRLTLVRGVEFGQPQFNSAEAARFTELHRPGFIIGSIHYLDPSYDIGMSSVASHEPCGLYRAYLRLVLEMVSDHDFDVLGHLTYPWRYFKRELDYDFDERDYRAEFDEIFDVIVQRGRGIELNTSGWRQALDDCLPNEAILRRYRARGGRIVTIGSDAHTPENVGAGIDRAAALLQACGFEGVATYEKREATIHAF